MNRSFLIVGIPAVLTSFGWLAFTWGLKLAAGVTAVELVVITACVVFVLRRQNQRNRARLAGANPKPGAELMNSGQ